MNGDGMSVNGHLSQYKPGWR